MKVTGMPDMETIQQTVKNSPSVAKGNGRGKSNGKVVGVQGSGNGSTRNNDDARKIISAMGYPPRTVEKVVKVLDQEPPAVYEYVLEKLKTPERFRKEKTFAETTAKIAAASAHGPVDIFPFILP